ncbi:TetR/AcrR family transcriptional regulator [Alkalibaculum sporogenes]|uniref:TetR/AcrR family transcriptional regulator n=1 Tax=Alkalibaculum sporogenes TaxID=2655001 RepID=UPI00187BBF18|nr:TetR/AcrR family transcriptional regulator [Alkalibaculum sporogenes]
MATYDNGLNTKETIINSCKKLFYENGYVKTTYSDICEDANINQGSIYYHFKRKNNIAGIIYCDFLSQNKKFIHNIIGDKYGLQICTAVEIRNYWNMFLNDEKAKKFYYEIAKERIVVESFKETGEEFFRLHRKEYNLDIDDEKLKLINLSSSAIESECIIGLIDNYIHLTIDGVSDFEIRTIYEFMEVSYKRIEEILRISKEIYSKMNVRMNKYFKLELMKDI